MVLKGGAEQRKQRQAAALSVVAPKDFFPEIPDRIGFVHCIASPIQSHLDKLFLP